MRKLINYFKEAIAELGKISWPNRQTTIRLTVSVLVFSVTLSAFMGTVDLGLNQLVKRLFVG